MAAHVDCPCNFHDCSVQRRRRCSLALVVQLDLCSRTFGDGGEPRFIDDHLEAEATRVLNAQQRSARHCERTRVHQPFADDPVERRGPDDPDPAIDRRAVWRTERRPQRNRVDELGKKVRGIDQLEARIAKLEKELAALKRAQKPRSAA